MKRLISLLVHMLLFNFITIGFNGAIEIIFTISLMITLLTLFLEPILEFKYSMQLKKLKHKAKMDQVKLTAPHVLKGKKLTDKDLRNILETGGDVELMSALFKEEALEAIGVSPEEMAKEMSKEDHVAKT